MDEEQPDYEEAYQQILADVVGIRNLLNDGRPLEALRRANETVQRHQRQS